MDSKLLELAFNKNVPEDVKTAAKNHLLNLQAIDKADAKMKQARDEKNKAQVASEQSAKAFADLLAKWTPA